MLSKHACLQGTKDLETVGCGLCWAASPGATVQNERMGAPPPTAPAPRLKKPVCVPPLSFGHVRFPWEITL